VEEVHEDKVICNEGTGNERVWEVVDRHCEVVDIKFLVYVKFVGFNFLLCSKSLSKSSKLENSIINIGDRKLVTL